MSSPGPSVAKPAGRGAYAIRALSDLCLGNPGVWKEKDPPKRGPPALGTLRKEGLGFSASGELRERRLVPQRKSPAGRRGWLTADCGARGINRPHLLTFVSQGVRIGAAVCPFHNTR